MLRRTPWVRCGHPKLPWPPTSTLYDRDDVKAKVKAIVKNEMVCINPARSLWRVVHASGRSGSGKTEIGKQLPRLLSESSAEMDLSSRQILAKSAYLLIECNGGGDGFDEKDMVLHPSHRMGWRLLAAVCRDSIKLNGVKQRRARFANGK